MDLWLCLVFLMWLLNLVLQLMFYYFFLNSEDFPYLSQKTLGIYCSTSLSYSCKVGFSAYLICYVARNKSLKLVLMFILHSLQMINVDYYLWSITKVSGRSIGGTTFLLIISFLFYMMYLLFKISLLIWIYKLILMGHYCWTRNSKGQGTIERKMNVCNSASFPLCPENWDHFWCFLGPLCPSHLLTSAYALQTTQN